MTGADADVVHRKMLDRPVDPARYRGLVREDKTLRWARDALSQVELLRRRPPAEWSSTAEVRRLAELLTELGWDDLAAVAYREELAVLRALDVARPGIHADEIGRTMAELRVRLVRTEAFEEALDLTDEQLRSSTGQAARDARGWRTVILAALGRHEEAAESAAVAVDEIRARRAQGVALTQALTTYANLLDRAGRVAEAADVTAEVLGYWRKRSGVTPELARSVNLLSDRLVRSDRAEEARAVIIQALPRLRRHEHRIDADTWHALGVRLFALGRPDAALTAGAHAVTHFWQRTLLARDQHRTVQDEDWDDDHRYTTEYLFERHAKKLETSREDVRRAERSLLEALMALSTYARELGRTDEADAADAEAASLGSRPQD
ncbi:hypothetical protein [Dactylosporangium matsuzakiense]|nr:hypothetical protein [Dactylosporangium matsuzakiense]